MGLVVVVLVLAIVLAPRPVLAGPPATNTALATNFSNLSIPAGDWIWFSAVVQSNQLPNSNPQHFYFEHQSITFSVPNGSSWTIRLGGANLEYNQSPIVAWTSWNPTDFNWTSQVPWNYSGNAFLSGWAYSVPLTGIPAGVHVSWTGQIYSSRPCSPATWTWEAAVYTDLPHPYSTSNLAELGVKPTDGNQVSSYSDMNPAGTPENFTGFLTPGATGTGGLEYTGSPTGLANISQCGMPAGG
ncbi:MAG: hypothetical protein ACREC5_07785 [Thermoplasmata archaeon]